MLVEFKLLEGEIIVVNIYQVQTWLFVYTRFFVTSSFYQPSPPQTGSTMASMTMTNSQTKEAPDAYASWVHGMLSFFSFLWLYLLMFSISTTRLQLRYVGNRNNDNNNNGHQRRHHVITTTNNGAAATAAGAWDEPEFSPNDDELLTSRGAGAATATRMAGLDDDRDSRCRCVSSLWYVLLLFFYLTLQLI